jgi:N4-gp56 family major capsid protein
MAYTTSAAGLTVKQWDDQFFTEYLGNHPFKGEMGTSENSVIHMKEDLTKKTGDTIVFALANDFAGNPNDGTTRMDGSEEALTTRSFPLTVGLRRNAFLIREMEEQKSAIDLRNAGKAAMKAWTTRQDVLRICRQLHAVDGLAYGTATAPQRNTWLVNNTDRVLFGSVKSGAASGVMATALLTVDNTVDKLTAASLSLMKRIALSASPKITPLMIEKDNRRWFKVFAHPLCFRDLKNDPVIIQAQREVQIEQENNRLFKGGDIVWDGMIVSEVDDYVSQTYTGAGTAGIDVGGVHLLGAQAMGMAIAARWETREKSENDYGNEQGFGYRAIDSIEKLRFGTGAGDTTTPKDNGVVSGFFAAVADA